MPADELGALTHAAHAEPALEAIAARAEPLGVRKPAAVVGDRRLEYAVALGYAHHRPARFGVAAHVRQRLLNDAVDRALELGVQPPNGVDILAGPLAEVDLDHRVQSVDRLRAARERLQRGGETEVVERGGPELGNQVAQPVDLVAKALERGVDGLRQSLRIALVARVGERETQRADPLDAFVVDLARPACALALTRLVAVAQTPELGRADLLEPPREVGREGSHVGAAPVGEAAVAAQRDDQPGRPVLDDERLDQRRSRLETQLVQPRRILAARRIERERLAGTIEAAKGAPRDGHDVQTRFARAFGGDHAQLGLLLERDQERVGLEQPLPADGREADQPDLGFRQHGSIMHPADDRARAATRWRGLRARRRASGWLPVRARRARLRAPARATSRARSRCRAAGAAPRLRP